jgi:asparagine synthase (glutamine-hydrolysing)
MCGIVGIYAYQPAAAAPDRAELRRIRDHMAARGPDGAGEWVSTDGRVALGHRRLSIIDLSDRAAQPMQAADGHLVITFNGEIYNYRALRSELESQGYIFRTQSDTEVLLHLYAAHGKDMVHKLRGMFAFAIWDHAKRALFLARDPYGIKPLYYSDDGKAFRFASQVKALLAGGRVSPDPDPAGWVGFYYFGTIPEPFTTYRSVRALPAGATLWIDHRVAEPAVYAPLSQFFSEVEPEPPIRSKDDLIEIVRAGLLDSVRHHMVSDVPVGLFLSAGIDSGALLGLMRDAHAGEIRSVTLAYEEFRHTAQDEAPLAVKCAQQYGCSHTVRRVTEAEFREDLPKILDAMDQPTIDGINTWFVSKAARELGLKAAISGLGGDELFGGYPSYRDIPRLVRTVGRLGGIDLLPGALRPAIDPLVRRWHPKLLGLIKYGNTFPRAYFLLRGLFMPWDIRSVIHDSEFLREGMQRFDPLEYVGRVFAPSAKADFAKVASLETSIYMRNQLLRDTDWASMAHSLEVRVPYVDFELLKAICSAVLALPARAGKRILGNIPSRPLPPEIVSRRKTGFGTPVDRWLQTDPRVQDWRRVRKLAAPSCPWARRWAYQVAMIGRQGLQARSLIFSGKIEPRQRSLIVFRIGSIGDTVCALPCFHQIAQRFPDHERILLTDIPTARKGAPVEAVIGNSGLVHRILYFPAVGRTIADLLRLRRQIRRTKAKTVVYVADRPLSSTIRDILFFYLCGVTRIIGARLRRRDRFPQRDVGTGSLEYESERLARCLSSLGRIDLSDPAFWDLRLGAGEIAVAERALGGMNERPFIAINLGGKVESKNWGDANWAILLERMVDKYQHLGLVFFGSSDEWERAERMTGTRRDAVLNLCGMLTPRQTAAALGQAALFIGHDSGPMHLAAAVNVPCVCVFGNYNQPRVWHPYGKQHRIIHNMSGVKAIAPLEVLAAVELVLLVEAPVPAPAEMALT